MTQPLKWHGGKHYLAPWIIDHFPAHMHYVETHFGGGSVFFCLDGDGVSEVINDINGSVMNFWAVLADDEALRQLKRILEATPFSEPLWHQSAELMIPRCDPMEVDIDAAAAFFIRCRQSRQGTMQSFATLSKRRTQRGMNEQVSAWLSSIDGLKATHARLKRAVILNKDAVDVIRSEDSEVTLFYCDPPYLPDTRSTPKVYTHEMSEEQHIALLDALEGIKGKFVLSGYDHPLYEEYAEENGWHRTEKQIDNKASGKKVKEIKTECLWMNFLPSVAA